MKKLINVPSEQRDAAWEEQFLTLLPGTSFKLIQDNPMEGPDNMPYLPVNIVDSGESAIKIFRWLGEKGVGMVISPSKQPPDFVLTYGMIWNFLANGQFIEKQAEAQPSEGDFQLKEGQSMYAGVPNEGYLPSSARKLFRHFLLDQGITKPRIVMLSMDNKNFDLCFSWESLGKPPKEEWQGILEGFSWFFPLHYSFSILSESAIKNFQFVDL